ncbi:MAG: EamA family transporter [Arenicellales bacterium WSBS_2016_MAG_OTU3]
MEIWLVFLVLFAALLHATWNAILKAGGDRLLIMATIHAISSLFSGVAIFFVGIPDAASWPYLIASVIIHTAYYTFLVKAYHYGDLSQVYPLARGCAPILVVIGGATFAQEWLSPVTTFGVGLACVGIISLAFEKGVPWKQNSSAVKFALLTSLMIGSYTLVDGLGVRAAGKPFAYIFWLFFIEGIPFAMYAAIKRRGKVKVFLKQNWLSNTIGSVISMAAYSIVIFAMSLGTMGAVSALRETSVIFAVLIGCFLLKETFGPIRITAVILVTAGVIIMRVSQ